MVTIAIANHKGGVGKTATAQNLGAALAGVHDLRVLLVDLDPQASLTLSCGIKETEGRSLAEVIGGANPGRLAVRDVIHPLGENLAIAPADIALAATELGLTSRLGRESVIRRLLAPVREQFDVCLVDCPPSLGLLTVGGLVAADAVIVPTIPQVVDLRGLRLFLVTVNRIRDELNPELSLLGILVTFYDTRLTHHKAAIETMEEAGLPVLTTRIGRSVRVAESAGAGQSVTEYEAKNPRAEEYRRLAEEVAAWLANRKD